MPKISALTSLAQASVDTAADVLPIVDATAPATTKKVTVQAMVNAGLAAAAPQGGIFALTGALTVSGASGLGVTTVTGVDASSYLLGVRGTTKGVRVLTSVAGTAIDGVDNTLSASFEPLFLRGSAVSLSSGGTQILLANITGVGVTGVLGVTGQASFTDGSAAAPSVKIGDEQNGLYSDGAGSLSFATAGARVVRMGTVGGTGNYLRLDANNTPLITAVAGATNADIGLVSAGTGAILLATNGSIATTQVRVSHVASAVNYWDFTGAATGSGIRVDATGSDSGVNGFFVAKGSGVWNFCTSGSASNRQFQIGHIASAVNYIQATGAATGNTPNFAVGGSDANVYFNYYTKGSGAHQFLTGGGLQLLVGHVASAVNYLQVTGSATGNAVTISGAGSDSNIDFAITPKGTGVLRFGAHRDIAAETVTGYITIKDSEGNTRKLAVLS